MASGTMRVHIQATAQNPHGVYPFPLDFMAVMMELFVFATVEVADGVVNQSLIALGAPGLTAIEGLILVSSVAISLKLGATGSNIAFPLAANAPFVLLSTSLSNVSISNASGEEATVTYMCYGS